MTATIEIKSIKRGGDKGEWSVSYQMFLAI